MLKTVLRLVAMTVLLLGLFYLVEQLKPSWAFSKVYVLIGVFFLLSLLTVRANIWAIKQKSLVTIFIASQVVRIIFSLVVLFLLATWIPAEINILAVNFFIVYLFYLIFEIMELLSNLRAEFRRP